MTPRDQNGNVARKNIRRAEGGAGWLADVWFGGGYGQVTTVRTCRYATRQAARQADISNEIGKNGCIG